MIKTRYDNRFDRNNSGVNYKFSNTGDALTIENLLKPIDLINFEDILFFWDLK